MPRTGRPTSTAIAIVDSGPLYAWVDRSDLHHERCLAALSRTDLRLVVPMLAIAEVVYFVARHLGAHAEATFLRGVSHFEVEPPVAADWDRIADLCEQYADFPLGTVDASIVALAERLETNTIITIDRRHFAAVRPRHVPAFHLLPE